MQQAQVRYISTVHISRNRHHTNHHESDFDKSIDPEAKCFFDLPRELRDMIYEFYFINSQRAVRRARAKGKSFRERRYGGDEDFDFEDLEAFDSDESDGIDYDSQDSDDHRSNGNSHQDDSDSSSEFRPPGGYRHRPEIDRAYSLDAYRVRFSTYRDEIVINQDQKLHACLPLLTRTSRQLLAETWSFSFDVNHKFIVHIDSWNIRPLLERQGVFRLLSDVCGVDKISEENTTVVMHSATAEDDLKWWLKRHWYEGLPLFDTNLEIQFQESPPRNGGIGYGSCGSHPIFQRRAEFQRKCLGIIRYMRLIHIKDSAKWEALALQMVKRLDQVELKMFDHVRSFSYRRRGASPMKAPEPEDHTDLVEAVFDAVEWIIWPGGRRYQVDWEWHAADLARSTFQMARNEVKNLYGIEFEAIEQRHRQAVVPMKNE